jgi:hypothetical protein
METASFQGLIDVIIFIIIFYYAVKILARLFLPVLAKKVVEKASQQFEQQYQNHQNQQASQSQAKTNDIPKEKKIVGDYVDFEEIE